MTELQAMVAPQLLELAGRRATLRALGDDAGEKAEAARLVAEAFIEREPMVRALHRRDPAGVEAAMAEVAPGMVADVCAKGLPLVVALDDGSLAAVMLSLPWDSAPIELPPALEPVARVLNQLGRSAESVLRERAWPRTYEVLMVAVARDFEAFSLPLKLFSATARSAQAQGFSEIGVKATSISQLILRRVGFQSLAGVPYRSLPELASVEDDPENQEPYAIREAQLCWARIADVSFARSRR